MLKTVTRSLVLFFILLVAITGLVSGSDAQKGFSFKGTVKYIDLEGGFYGIITDAGKQILPVNLPDKYKINDLSVQGFAIPDTQASSIQMWGDIVNLDTVEPSNGIGFQEIAWNSGSENDTAIPGTQNIDTQNLLIVSATIQKKLDEIDQQLMVEASNLTEKTIKTSDYSSMLTRFSSISSSVYEVTGIDVTGTIIAVAPDTFISAIGVNVGNQSQIIQMKKYPAPSMTRNFLTIEGKNGVIITYPVYNEQKKLAGFVTAILDPQILIQEVLSSLPDLSETRIMVLQPDGKILYDADSNQVGISTWEEPFNVSPSFINTAVKLQNSRAGIDQYVFPDNGSSTDMKKIMLWTTVSLHNTPWRVSVISA